MDYLWKVGRYVKSANALEQTSTQKRKKRSGSSIRDYRDANGNVGAFQNSFAVYGRGEEPCRTCGRPLEKARIAGRATVFCPHCQR